MHKPDLFPPQMLGNKYLSSQLPGVLMLLTEVLRLPILIPRN